MSLINFDSLCSSLLFQLRDSTPRRGHTRVPERTSQKEALFDRLICLSNEGLWFSVILLGPAGSGRLSVLSDALFLLQSHIARSAKSATTSSAPISTSLVRIRLCASHHSSFSEILTEICNCLNANGICSVRPSIAHAGLSWSQILNALIEDRKSPQGRTFIFILDEFERFARDSPDFLYMLLDLHHEPVRVGVVGISSDYGVIDLIEKRSRSRSGLSIVSFERYSGEQMAAILQRKLTLYENPNQPTKSSSSTSTSTSASASSSSFTSTSTNSNFPAPFLEWWNSHLSSLFSDSQFQKDALPGKGSRDVDLRWFLNWAVLGVQSYRNRLRRSFPGENISSIDFVEKSSLCQLRKEDFPPIPQMIPTAASLFISSLSSSSSSSSTSSSQVFLPRKRNYSSTTVPSPFLLPDHNSSLICMLSSLCPLELFLIGTIKYSTLRMSTILNPTPSISWGTVWKELSQLAASHTLLRVYAVSEELAMTALSRLLQTSIIKLTGSTSSYRGRGGSAGGGSGGGGGTDNDFGGGGVGSGLGSLMKPSGNVNAVVVDSTLIQLNMDPQLLIAWSMEYIQSIPTGIQRLIQSTDGVIE